MKNFLTLFFILFCIDAFAQFKFKKDWDYDPTDNCYAKNRFYFGVQYELPSLIVKKWEYLSSNGNYAIQNIGPLGLYGEYSLQPKFGIVFGYHYQQAKTSWGALEPDSNGQFVIPIQKGFQYQSHLLSLGVQNHLYYSKHLDIFMGLRGGFAFQNFKNTKLSKAEPKDFPTLETPWHGMAYMGLRVFFANKYAAYLHAGLGNISNANIGLLYRFGY
jgi:hypothetical protein